MHVLGNLGMGGAEMGVLRLIQNLKDERIRHSIAILGSDRSLLDQMNVDIPCHALDLQGRCFTAFWRLAKRFRRERVDIVHVNNLAPWPDAALAARLAGCRCIETFHGVEEGRLRFSFLKQMLFRGAGFLSSRITAVADEAADLLTGLTGISRDAVQVIPNGVDTANFSPVASLGTKRDLRRSKNLPEDALLLGCVAALRPVKNHRGLLRAFAGALKGVATPVVLVLVGDGPLAAELQTLAAELGIGEQVHFLGRRSDITELLQCFDAFVLNSDTEGLSYAVLEAMACGLPLIGTAVGGNVQLVRNDRQGMLVAVADEAALSMALHRAISGSEDLITMGQEARKMVMAHYGMAVMVDQYRKLYLELAGSREG